jgi:hypothetical protein
MTVVFEWIHILTAVETWEWFNKVHVVRTVNNVHNIHNVHSSVHTVRNVHSVHTVRNVHNVHTVHILQKLYSVFAVNSIHSFTNCRMYNTTPNETSQLLQCNAIYMYGQFNSSIVTAVMLYKIKLYL